MRHVDRNNYLTSTVRNLKLSEAVFLTLIREHTRHALKPRKSFGIVSIDIFPPTLKT